MARGRGTKRIAARCAGLAIVTLLSCHAFDAWAQLPSGGSVVAGQASITSTSATSLLIQQGTPKAIIDWNRFSIGSNASVAVQQPGAGALLLNRVTGNAPSWLLGTLTANGQVWLVNPAGIYVGAGAHLTAAGLLLSTADIANRDFLAGNYDFGVASGDPRARIVNRGHLVATDGGSVVLAAPQVRNDGVIEADLGTVVLAGATTYTVDFAGDNLLSFAVTGAVTPAGTAALVDNAGTIAAAGGRVLLTADAAKGVLDNVINTSGIVEATSVAKVNGQIVLSGTGGGTLVSGTLDASGKGAGETGGTVTVLGDTVTLAAGARLDASGDAGGGTVLVGGNFHGAGPQANATATTIAHGASIAADAITSGRGGRVAVWSDGTTSFAGSITARGGASGGDGGYIETSGHQLAIASGAIVNAGAPYGARGTWLLDPDDIEIAPGSGSDVNIGSLGVGNPSGPPTTGFYVASPCQTTGCAILYASDIQQALSSGSGTDVVVSSTSGPITIDPGVSIAWSTATFLGLSSGGNIIINSGVSIQNAVPGADSASLQSSGSLTIGPASTLTVGSGVVGIDGAVAGPGSLTLNASLGIVVNSNVFGTSFVMTSSNAGTPPSSPSSPTRSPGNGSVDSGIVSQSVPSSAIHNISPPPSPPPVLPDATGSSAGQLRPEPPGGSPPPPPPPTTSFGTQADQPPPLLGGGDGGGASPMLTNVVDIDQGAQIFGTIAPNAGAAGGGGTGAGGAAAGPAAAGASGAAQGSLVGVAGGGIVGGDQFADIDPLTFVAAVRPAPQADPQSPTPDEPLGGRRSHIFQTRQFTVPVHGVPGIDEPSIAGGNRSLWFGRAEP